MQLISLEFMRDLFCFFHQVLQARHQCKNHFAHYVLIATIRVCHYLRIATIKVCHYLLSLPSQKALEVHPIIMQLISLKSTRDLFTKATNPCFHQVLQAEQFRLEWLNLNPFIIVWPWQPSASATTCWALHHTKFQCFTQCLCNYSPDAYYRSIHKCRSLLFSSGFTNKANNLYEKNIVREKLSTKSTSATVNNFAFQDI